MDGPNDCKNCTLNVKDCSGHTHQKITALLHEGHSLESLLRQLVNLRATHSCHLEAVNADQTREINKLRAEVATLKEERDDAINTLRERDSRIVYHKKQVSVRERELSCAKRMSVSIVNLVLPRGRITYVMLERPAASSSAK